MKKYLFLAVLAFAVMSCSKTVFKRQGRVPPGQMKKLTGSQSAKPYAPGQKKTTVIKTTTKKKKN